MSLPIERSPEPGAEALFRLHGRKLWALAYRLTGSAEDAEDVVQETFARLLAQPPRAADTLPAWLARVATNLGIDALRRRRRRAYTGAWLPQPVEEEEPLQAEPRSAAPDAEARYGLLESATFAFLIALEALGPRARAMLLLRDVFDYSAAEAAGVLGTTPGNARVLHLRARRAMEAYDRARCIPTPELYARHRQALERLLGCLLAEDTSALESLLAEAVRTETDAGGAFTALAASMEGRARVARFYVRAAKSRREGGPQTRFARINGLPALVIALAHPVRRQAPRTVLRCELGADGRIARIHSVLAPRKLGRVAFPA
jgi:RNA polymerase sigma-70 factor (ECF subfamily)